MSSSGKIEFVGTGIMGAPMVRSLRRAGYEVRAWNRSCDKAETLAGDGITRVGTPSAVIEEARRELFAYIEGYYTRKRIHSALGYITPEQAEQRAS